MKPIWFSTNDVRAILSGRKTVTRRAVKLNNDGRDTLHGLFSELNGDNSRQWAGFYKESDIFYIDGDGEKHIDAVYYRAPYKSSDVLYVRETYRMPKEAARIFLRVKAVRVEQLQDIAIEDCKAEGITLPPPAGDEFDDEFDSDLRYWFTFQDVWDSTIKSADRDRCGWNANPWVWVIEFERISKETEERE